MCGIIGEDYFKTQDKRWYQPMTSGTQVAYDVCIGIGIFIDIYRNSKAPPRFHGPFVIVKKLDKRAVVLRVQDGSTEIVHLDPSFLKYLVFPKNYQRRRTPKLLFVSRQVFMDRNKPQDCGTKLWIELCSV